jgi:hypothetical protein
VPSEAWTALEPLLTLECERAIPSAELVAELNLELRSDDAKRSDLDETIKLTPTTDELLHAAEVLDEALRRFPSR